MTLDVSRPIVTFEDDVIHDTEGGPVTTLGKICIQVLMEDPAPPAPPVPLIDGLEKYRRYQLAQSIGNAKDGIIVMEAQDIALIKELVGAKFPPIIVGPVFELLEGGAMPAPTEISNSGLAQVGLAPPPD